MPNSPLVGKGPVSTGQQKIFIRSSTVIFYSVGCAPVMSTT